MQRDFICRSLVPKDFPQVRQIMDTVYPNLGGSWPQVVFENQLYQFPFGQIGIAFKEKIIGFALSMRISESELSFPHEYLQLTDFGWLHQHNPRGNILYGVDVCVDPEFQLQGVGRRLYEGRKSICQQLNIKKIVAGGRIPGYCRVKYLFSIPEYVKKVINLEYYDPVLSFQLRNGFEVKHLMENYQPSDIESGTWATWLEWENPSWKGDSSFVPKKLLTQV